MPEIEFTLRDFFHPVAIARLGRAFARHEREPAASWQAWREARLRELLSACRRTPYWRRRFAELGVSAAAIADLATESGLSRLPSLSKDEVRRAAESLHADDAARHSARPSFTSGTSGHPVPFLVDRHARVLEFAYYQRHWSWAGFRLGVPFAQLNAHHFLRRGWHTRVAHWQPHLRRLMLNSTLLARANVEEFAGAMRRHRVRFLKGLASPLYFLALLFEEAGIRDVRLAGIFSTGENLVAARRASIERAFFAKAFDSYGLLEQAASICECPDGGLHVNTDYAHHEFVPTSFVTPDGRPLHAILGTPLHNRSMPLLRYEVGDLVELAPAGARCPCGRAFPLVRAIHGRTEDSVLTPDGRCVTALFVVPDAVAGIQGVQFLQEDERTLRVCVVPTPAFDRTNEAGFIAHARALVGPEMDIVLERVADDRLRRGPTGKVPLVLSALPRARVFAEGSERAL